MKDPVSSNLISASISAVIMLFGCLIASSVSGLLGIIFTIITIASIISASYFMYNFFKHLTRS